jgi:hypothetical protein
MERWLQALPRTRWIWGPNGKRVQVWADPSDVDNPVSDLAPMAAPAEGSDQSAVTFTAVPMPQGTPASRLDEFALDVLLAQCSKPDGGKLR